MRVAIVGTGPAGCYALQRLLESGRVDSVSLLDRLPTPGGLIRAGVAPDHQETKRVFDGFARSMRDPRVHCYLGVDVGRDISHADLRRHHHAVIYAVGAAGARRLGIDGEDLPGSHAATEFVAFYNGHPDFTHSRFDLSHRRAVIVGTGNVALDVARVLTAGADRLERTDIADHALAALADSAVEEVVLLGRRGPETAAFSTPELLALTQLDGVDLICDPADFTDVGAPAGYTAQLKLQVMAEAMARTPTPGHKRIVLRFHTTPTAVIATGGHVSGLWVRDRRADDLRPAGCLAEELLDTGLVLRSIGYRGSPLAGLPFDDASGTVANTAGRVEAGVYVTGWCKRGPSGMIGTNRHCADETVGSLLEDVRTLSAPPADAFAALVRQRTPHAVGIDGWTRIDAREREAGLAESRPRVKLTSVAEMREVAAAELARS